MLDLIVVNLRRRPARTLLTATGIAVGVATIVALLALTTGLNRSAGELVHLGRSDLGIFQRDASDPTTSILPTSLVPKLVATPEVADATPMQLLVEAVRGQPSAVVFGADTNGFVWRRLVLLDGRYPRSDGEVVIGRLLAREAGARPGSSITIKGRRFRVAGVYSSGIFFEDLGAMMPLAQAQRLANRSSNETTTIAVQLAQKFSARDARTMIERRYPGTRVISEPSEAARAGANTVLIAKAVLLIAVLALIVGGLGVANTMLMSILERQGELAVLATVGWSPRRLAGLVMGEAVGVSVIGAALGLLLGVVFSDVLARVLGLNAFVSPAFTAWALGRGLIVAFAIGILGGVYPTWRVARVDPAPVLARV